MSETHHPVDHLILDAATRALTLTPEQLQQVVEHVAEVGFEPTRNVRATGLAGMVWQGQVLTGSDRLTSAERHYLRHVVRQHEWPSSTGLADYLGSIRDAILDPTSCVFTSRHRYIWQLGVVREARQLRGPRGYDWLLVEYRPSLGYWVTGYQFPGLQDLYTPERTEFQWLRPPT